MLLNLWQKMDIFKKKIVNHCGKARKRGFFEWVLRCPDNISDQTVFNLSINAMPVVVFYIKQDILVIYDPTKVSNPMKTTLTA